MTNITLRHGEAQDLAAIVEIYNRYVLETPVTFDVDPFEVEDRRDWFAQFAPGTRHQIFVAEQGNDILGYATSQPLKPKQAYETSVETSIYLKQGAEGQGLGHKLYSALLTALEQADVHRAYGLVVVPNEASVALHIKHGFRPCSVFKEIGRKFGKFHDVQWFERPVPLTLP
jgi:phosphinothricin acetyltransferase